MVFPDWADGLCALGLLGVLIFFAWYMDWREKRCQKYWDERFLEEWNKNNGNNAND